jgi:hypothetical protein
MLPLLVPISVQAFLVNSKVNNGVVFARKTNNYENLNRFLDPIPEPFKSEENQQSKPALGVHLHWRLPAALTHGVSAADSTSVEFPYTPNRWVVVRLDSIEDSTASQHITAWVIESDYLDPNQGTIPFPDPFSSTATNVQNNLLGRNQLIQKWQGETGGQLFLRATGVTDVAFTAYQPGLLNVYAFHDDTTNLAENAMLTYLVAGWYSDPSYDPLASKSPSDLNWNVLSGDSAEPNLSVYHGLIHGLKWQTVSIPERDDSSATSMQVAVGYSAIDALAAIIAQRVGGTNGSELETKFQAFQYNLLETLDAPDGTAQLELKIHEAWFGSSPGGTMWDIVTVSQGQVEPNPINSDALPPPPPLNAEQAEWLAALNQSQRRYDIAQRELTTLQYELFSLWWKQQRALRMGVPEHDEQKRYGINVTEILKMVTAELDITQADSYVNQVIQQQNKVSILKTKVPDPTSLRRIEDWSKEIPGNDGSLILKPNALPPFFHPADPVVLIAGTTPQSNNLDSNQSLPCRHTPATVTGVSVAGVAEPVTIATGNLASTIQIPVNSYLPVPIATAISALAVEAYFVDPNNAASIISNGLALSESGMISSLKAAMEDRTAQVASIPQPLQARFAFEKWKQAWSPLFLDWEITWLPSVTTSANGPFHPPRAARTSDQPNGAQDNWPFDPDKWTFDGRDYVAQRGSEYYLWKGGDIWGPQGVGKRTYIGRTFLTPQATLLFIRRLKDYIELHPDQDLSQIQVLIENIGETQFLSQTLSGFNDAFLMRSHQHSPPPEPQTPIANAINDEYNGVPDVTKGDQNMKFSGGTPFFFPLRGGFFQFERLRIVDAFGQVLSLLAANGNDTGNANGFFPFRGAGLVPDPNSGIHLAQRRLMQAPRIVQPNRLNFHLLDSCDDTKEIDYSPRANPVCGWLIPNHLNKSIAVYDAAGVELGEMILMLNSSGMTRVRWLAAPDRQDNPITDPSQIANPHLRDALSVFTSPTGGIPQDQRPEAFSAFLKSIDETLWTIDPISNRGDQDLVVLIGRPLALVRAQLQFELLGHPAYNQSWRDTLQQQTSDFTGFAFPIHLGSIELLDDGLVGYFTGHTYTTFNALHGAQSSTPYIKQIGPSNYISLPFNYPSYSTQTVTLLCDPRAHVYATTGILPTVRLALPAKFYANALAQMAVTFRIGPLLTDPEAIRMPLPAERQGEWTWIRRTGTGSTDWRRDVVLSADQQARLSDLPPHLMDGWLKFIPGAERSP